MKRGLLLLGLLSLGAATAWAQCTSYGGYSAFEGDLPIGPYCGGTGGGCTECIEWYPAPGVWFSDCYYDAWSDDVYCYSYGVENQGL